MVGIEECGKTGRAQQIVNGRMIGRILVHVRVVHLLAWTQHQGAALLVNVALRKEQWLICSGDSPNLSRRTLQLHRLEAAPGAVQ